MGRTAVFPLLSVTNQTQPEVNMPIAAEEKEDFSWGRLPCWERMVLARLVDISD